MDITKRITVNETLNKELFALAYHKWAMKIGFLGFNTASGEEKIREFKKYLKTIPQRPEASEDHFFNVGLAERQEKWDKEYMEY